MEINNKLIENNINYVIIPYSSNFYSQTKDLLFSYFDLVDDCENYLNFLNNKKNRIDYIALNKDKNVVGFIDSIVYKHLFKKNEAKLLLLLVKENYQRLGIGKNLFNTSKLDWLAHDVSKVSTIPSFLSSEGKYYEKLGFVQTKYNLELYI